MNMFGDLKALETIKMNLDLFMRKLGVSLEIMPQEYISNSNVQ